VFANIAQRRCAKQRIANGMQQYIGVRMAIQTFFMRDFYTADDALSPSD
jgi:hypothetical protein